MTRLNMRIGTVLLAVILALSVGVQCVVQAWSHPNMYLDAQEIEAIKAKVQAGEEPWASAYDQLIANANNALSMTPRSVTDNGDGHDYKTDDPYTTDGVYDPNADRTDYYNAIQVGHAVRDLGLAYALTQDSRYADKAIQLINTWAVNPDTYMTPKAKNNGPATPGHGSGGVIELFITIPGMFYGADLIYNYPGWNPADKQAFFEWARTIAYDAKDQIYQNNFENWRHVFLASAAALTDDSALLNYVFDRYREVLPTQIEPSGLMHLEYTRTRGLSYSLYAINAIIQTAEIARHHGVDLYTYMAPTGDGPVGLKTALDYYAPFALNPDLWPYQQITPIVAADNMALFELAYSFWPEEIFLNVIERWGRPMDETRIMGPVTLTHGNGVALEDPGTTPTPIPTPTPVTGNCLEVVGQWINTPIPPQSDLFIAEFHAIPTGDRLDAVMGLTDQPADDFSDLAAIVRFNIYGYIDARDGDHYAAAQPIPYQAGKRYHFRLFVNVDSRRYSAYVAEENGSERTIGVGFRFRTERQDVNQVSLMGMHAEPTQQLVCNITVTPVDLSTLTQVSYLPTVVRP